MPSQDRFKRFPLHKGEVAVVDRVVPGRLVYVTKKGAPPDESSIAFKLNQLIIRERDGSSRPYRGEPLADLGIKNGRLLNVGETEVDGEPTLVVETGPAGKHFISNVASNVATTISTAVVNTIDKFR
jgi:hypothetical protein